MIAARHAHAKFMAKFMAKNSKFMAKFRSVDDTHVIQIKIPYYPDSTIYSTKFSKHTTFSTLSLDSNVNGLYSGYTTIDRLH